MNTNSSPKVKKHFTLFLILVLVLQATTFFLVERGLRNTSRTASQLARLYEKERQLQSLKLLFEEKRNYSNNLPFHNNDVAQFESLKSQISGSIDSFNSELDFYVRYTNDSFISDHELEMSRNIEDLSNQYNSLILEMVVASAVSDTEAVEMLLSEAEPLAVQIIELFTTMQDYTQVLFHETSYSIDRNTNNTIILLLIVILALMFITIIIGILVRRSIATLDDSLPTEIKAAPHMSKDDATLLSEMRKCVSDLKAVAYDLSKSAEDIKK